MITAIVSLAVVAIALVAYAVYWFFTDENSQ
jgi:hypothetical protein